MKGRLENLTGQIESKKSKRKQWATYLMSMYEWTAEQKQKGMVNDKKWHQV